MEYQKVMRQQFIDFVKERALLEEKEKSVKQKEGIIERRLNRLKEDAEYRLHMID